MRFPRLSLSGEWLGPYDHFLCLPATINSQQVLFLNISWCIVEINLYQVTSGAVSQPLKPGTHHAIFVVCWTQRRRKDDCCMVCAHQRQLSPVDFTNATVVGPIRKTNRSNNCCMVCAGQRHLSHQPTGHRPITVKHFRDA